MRNKTNYLRNDFEFRDKFFFVIFKIRVDNLNLISSMSGLAFRFKVFSALLKFNLYRFGCHFNFKILAWLN